MPRRLSRQSRAYTGPAFPCACRKSAAMRRDDTMRDHIAISSGAKMIFSASLGICITLTPLSISSHAPILIYGAVACVATPFSDGRLR